MVCCEFLGCHATDIVLRSRSHAICNVVSMMKFAVLIMNNMLLEQDIQAANPVETTRSAEQGSWQCG